MHNSARKERRTRTTLGTQFQENSISIHSHHRRMEPPSRWSVKITSLQYFVCNQFSFKRFGFFSGICLRSVFSLNGYLSAHCTLTVFSVFCSFAAAQLTVDCSCLLIQNGDEGILFAAHHQQTISSFIIGNDVNSLSIVHFCPLIWLSLTVRGWSCDKESQWMDSSTYVRVHSFRNWLFCCWFVIVFSNILQICFRTSSARWF